jgi:uncharacterized membrane protein SirB2
MLYATLKHLHVAFVVLSLGGFLLRGWWMLQGSALLRHRITRVLPHVNDSALLAAGIGLAVITRQYPLVQPWLTAKLAALLLYIGLGTLALKRGRTRSIRVAAFAGALLTFAYMLAVALTRQAWPLT